MPTHRGTFQLQYSDPRFLTIAFDLQACGAQFDDDLNTSSRVLPSYSLADLSVAHDFGRRFEVFAAVQNLFDEEYFVGSLPTLVGAPRLISAGVRVRIQGH